MIFKCKMCGGNLEVNKDISVGTCQYCGSTMTLPRLDNDKKANLYDRANHFRRNNEYDKAMAIYETILNEDTTDAEAYWSLVLCKYGIEYVEDPITHKRVPTCNRTNFTSIFADEDYKQALANADASARTVYEAEASVIDDIQKGILEISQKEEPFDVFICYKETDNSGRRTPDSVLAQELYFELTEEGYKVFFSRITLEDKLGSAYEPYIFAALNSAKVMVVVGTKAEYLNAPWVKNEWNRYLASIKDGSDKTLIPAYKDMEPYDLPEEFSHLQAQDMGKLGFMQDLVRGIQKMVSPEHDQTTQVKEKTVTFESPTVDTLLKRVFIFLEDADFSSADEYCERVLDLDPENAKAYIGKLMAQIHVLHENELANSTESLENYNAFQKALRYADEDYKKVLLGYNQEVLDKIEERSLAEKKAKEEARKAQIYDKACINRSRGNSEAELKVAAEIFREISGYKDADTLAKECDELAESFRIMEEHNIKERRKQSQIAAKRKKIFTIILAGVVCAIIIITISWLYHDNMKNKAAVQPVIDAINSIGTVTIDSEDDIYNIVFSYDVLTDKQKKMVANYSALEDAFAALDAAYAQPIIVAINSIGTVTVDSETAISEAFNSYDQLTEEQKSLVTNYKVLQDANIALGEVKNDPIKKSGLIGMWKEQTSDDRKDYLYFTDVELYYMSATKEPSVSSFLKSDFLQAPFYMLNRYDFEKKVMEGSWICTGKTYSYSYTFSLSKNESQTIILSVSGENGTQLYTKVS